jgi:tRNA threonylcarbamoyladenosine biosynthesis protein TsaB
MTPPNPRLLIVETSGRVGQVALAEGDDLKRSRRLEESRRHARDLVPAVADLLTAQGWQPRDLQGVIVSRGPGSYTGLRVGIMSAKTFAYALGCPVVGVETFAALALQAPEEAVLLDVIADAQQDRIYLQRFTRSGPAGSLAIVGVTDWLARREAAWVTGPGLHVYDTRLPVGIQRVDASAWDARPESLLRLGLARYRGGETDDVWSLEPLYLRPSSAEEKWQSLSRT